MFRFAYSTVLCSSVIAVMAQNRTTAVPSLTVTVQDTFIRTLPDGNTITKTVTGQLYRDSQGRTRIERGQLVTIQDPTTQTTVVIDFKSSSGRRFTSSSKAPSGPSMSAVTDRQIYHDLGTRIISGIKVIGKQFMVALPAGSLGNREPISQSSEIWRSEELGLVVQTTSADLLNGEHTQLLSNIVPGAHVDATLFTVPAGVQVADLQPESQSGSQKLP